MAAGKANFLIVYKQSAQVYSATNLATALNTPLPKGCELKDRRILFTSFLPDMLELCVFPLTEEQQKVEEDESKKVNDQS